MKRNIYIFLLTIALASCKGGGGGNTGSTSTSSSSNVPTKLSVSGYEALMISTSTASFARFRNFPSIIPYAYASSDSKKLVGVDNGSVKKPEFQDDDSNIVSPQVSDLKDVGNGHLLIAFYSPGVGNKYGLFKKSTGDIEEVTDLVDDDEEQYIVIRGNLMYVGKPSTKTITEVNLTTQATRQVNDPAVNPVRFTSGFPGSAGGMVIAKDFQNGGNIVLAMSDSGAACYGAQSFCLYFDDGSTQPLDNIDSGYPNTLGSDAPWPGLSMIYGGDEHIYSWNAGYSTGGGAGTNFYSYFYKYEYSKTALSNGKNGKLTKTTIATLSNAQLSAIGWGYYPAEIPTRDNGWYDSNKDKYYLTPYGFIKIAKDSGTGVVTMVWTSLDLRASTEVGGPGSNYLTWWDSMLGVQVNERPHYIYGEYFYWYKNNELRRIQLTSGATSELISSRSDIVNYSIAGGKIFFMTSTKTYSVDLSNIAGGETEEFSQNINIQAPVDL